MIAGIIKAKVLWFSKAEVNETFNACKGQKRLDYTESMFYCRELFQSERVRG